MYGDNGQDPSRPPTSGQYPQPGQYQGQYQNQPPAQYQGGGPNQQVQQPYQYQQAPPGDYQDPRLGEQAPPTGYYQVPPSGYPATAYQPAPTQHQTSPTGQQAPPPGHPGPYQGAPTAYQAPPSDNQTPPPGQQAPPAGYKQQQTSHGAYQGAPTGYPAPSNGQQLPPMGLLSVATTDYPSAPSGNQVPQTGGYQSVPHGNHDPSSGYRGPSQQVPPTGYYAPSNDYHTPTNMHGSGSTGYPAPSHGQQTPSDYQDPRSGYQPNPNGGYQSGSANHSGHYMQPMQQQQPQSNYAPLPGYEQERRRSPPQQPPIDPRTQYGQPEYQGEYRAGSTQYQSVPPREEVRQYDTRPNRNLLSGGMAQHPPQHHHHQQFDEEGRGEVREFGRMEGGFGSRNRMAPQQRNYGGAPQYDASDEEDEQLYRLSLLDRTDDGPQQGMRRGEGGGRRQYDGQYDRGMPLSAPHSYQQQSGHGQARPQSPEPDYWAMADKFERGTEEWMKLSILNILKSYSTVSPEEKDVKMVTVEHLSKILRSYDQGHRVPKGNRPDDAIGGTLGYRPDITWLNLLRQMRDDGLIRLHQLNVTALTDFAIFAPFDNHSPKFANPSPFLN